MRNSMRRLSATPSLRRGHDGLNLHRARRAGASRGGPPLRWAPQSREELAGGLIAAAGGFVGRHHGKADRLQVRYTCEDLDVLRRRLRDLERDVDRLLEQHEIGRLLTTIDGIG